jgi:pimeloyl-ACP methyl ester carboxylesterase
MKPIFSKVVILSICLSSYLGVAYAEPSIPPFYQAVSKMTPDGKLGQVIKKESVPTAVPGAQAWRIAYISSDVGDKKTISTALVVAPTSKAPAEGRPVMAWAHGTTGTAQSCGPSQLTNPAVPLNEYFLLDGNSWTDYGLPGLEAFIKEGYVVVGTDYQGLGGGGKHQYAVAITQAKDTIDSIRAVGSMQETGAGKKAIIYGWSQGGGTTIAAASMPDYIGKKGTAFDDIQPVGFVALAPYDVAVTMPGTKLDQAISEKMIGELSTNFSDNIFNFAHFSMTLWGTQAAFPNLKLTDLLTDDGAKVIDKIYSNKCLHASADTLNYAYGAGYKNLLKPQAQNTLAWAQAFVKGSVTPVKPVAPVVIYWGTKDTVVPPVMGELYQKQMCKLGGNISRVQLPGEQTHFSTPGSAAPLYMPWVKDRIAGKTMANACPQN